MKNLLKVLSKGSIQKHIFSQEHIVVGTKEYHQIW